MSLLKKIETDVMPADKELLAVLNVDQTVDDMLAELQKNGTLNFEDNPSAQHEDQSLQNAD